MPLLANLICGSPARNHDFDYARLRLLQALYDAGDIRTDVHATYDDGEAIAAADLLVSYTSQVPVAPEPCAALRRYLQGGGRWFALHASNSVRDNQELPPLLGSRFITHPPYTHFGVTVRRPQDPLLVDIGDFELDDELYVIEPQPGIEVLLETHWGGSAGGRELAAETRPLMYRHAVGEGSVLYLALGHCNRPFDVGRPGAPDQADHRGPWALPVYQELIRRGIAWAAHRRD
jgi:type 1 glutamine amidotransferase